MTSPSLAAWMIDTDPALAWQVQRDLLGAPESEWQATPPPVIRRSPLRFETVTLHVDRTALDARLYQHACALATEFLWERVTDIRTDGDRIVDCSLPDAFHHAIVIFARNGPAKIGCGIRLGHTHLVVLNNALNSSAVSLVTGFGSTTV